MLSIPLTAFTAAKNGKTGGNPEKKIIAKKGGFIMTGWKNIQTTEDADEFMKIAEDFHDFFVYKACMVTPSFCCTRAEATLFIIDTCCMRSGYELHFREVARFMMIPNPQRDFVIYNSLLRVKDGLITWAEMEDPGVTDIDHPTKKILIIAGNLSWRRIHFDPGTGSCEPVGDDNIPSFPAHG